MKKRILICLIIALLCVLCACGQSKQPEEVTCGHEAYSDLLARLEAGDYDGARSLIDAMEKWAQPVQTQAPEILETEPDAPTETVAAPTQPESAIVADCEIVELTKYNVRDYFEFRETYYISAQSQCQQYITLKEEYKNRLIALEDVRLDVAYLLCEAYGKADLEAEQFRSEYFEVTSQETEVRTLKPDDDGIFWINQMLYFKKDHFPEFAMDVEITSGSGKLILQ